MRAYRLDPADATTPPQPGQTLIEVQPVVMRFYEWKRDGLIAGRAMRWEHLTGALALQRKRVARMRAPGPAGPTPRQRRALGILCGLEIMEERYRDIMEPEPTRRLEEAAAIWREREAVR